jgi:hypothetical protein
VQSKSYACIALRTVWPSCIVAAPGPSLKAFGHTDIHLIAVGDAYRLFPEADILYAADLAWWQARNPKFAGKKLICQFPREPNREAIAKELGVTVIPARPGGSFSFRGAIHYGKHSGFQAINLGLRFSRLVVIVGFDMKGTHFFGAHKQPLRQKLNYSRWIAEMHEAARHLPKQYRIINATEDSALECFESMPLEDALNEVRKARQAHIVTTQDGHAGCPWSAHPGLGANWEAEMGVLLSGIRR